MVAEFERPGSEGYDMNEERRRGLVVVNLGIGGFSMLRLAAQIKGKWRHVIPKKRLFAFTFFYLEESNPRFTGFIFDRF